MKFSPITFITDIGVNTKCILNSLTLRKVYCSEEKYNKIEEDIKNSNKTPLVNSLIDAGFITENNSLTVEQIFQKISEQFPKTPAIICSYIMLNDACNFRCNYCFQSRKERTFMNRNLADKVIKVIEKNACRDKPFQIFFYGGEPLLNVDVLFYLVDELKKLEGLQFTFNINTNASLVTPEIAKKFKENNFNVIMSLDGWAELHDACRVYADGGGTYNDTVKGLLTLRKEGVRTTVSCTVTPHNYLYLPQMVTFFKRLGINDVGFNTPIGIEELRKNVDPVVLAHLFFKAFEAARALNMEEERVGQRRYKYFLKEVPKPIDCVGGGEQVYFAPDGRIGPCHAFYSHKEHHIDMPKDPGTFLALEHPLWKEWSRRSPLNMQQCWGCEAIAMCGGTCPYNCFLQTGTIWAKDEYLCKFMKIILRYLLRDYYEREVLGFRIEKINSDDLIRIPEFLEKLKKSSGVEYLNPEKIKDPILWGIFGINANRYEDGAFFLAKAKDEIVGYGMLFRKDGHWEYGTGLLAEYRQKGIGAKLLQATLDEAAKLSLTDVYVSIKKLNPALEFFKSAGFNLHKEKNQNSVYLVKKIKNATN